MDNQTWIHCKHCSKDFYDFDGYDTHYQTEISALKETIKRESAPGIRALLAERDRETVRQMEFIEDQIGKLGECENLGQYIGYMTAEISCLRSLKAERDKLQSALKLAEGAMRQVRDHCQDSLWRKVADEALTHIQKVLGDKIV